MNSPVYSVGILGAGPVTQAIHLPTLQRMPERFRIAHVMDADPGIAEAVAARVGARHGTDVTALLADPDVDVVAVCSPNAFHAEQVIAACHAHMRAVLCEKPLAMSADEAAAIALASESLDVPVIVGTMHAYDPAWREAVAAWDEAREVPHTVRVAAMIPPNPRSEDFATEIVGRPEPAPRPPRTRERDAENLYNAVMGLAIHDLPLARRLLPDRHPAVLSARALATGGYQILVEVGESLLELQGTSGAPWDPSWRLDAVSTTSALSVDFSLPYVDAGSSLARHTTATRAVEYGRHREGGYAAEWRHLHDVASGAAPRPDIAVVADDVTFALDIAHQAAAMIRDGEAAA